MVTSKPALSYDDKNTYLSLRISDAFAMICDVTCHGGITRDTLHTSLISQVVMYL